jgi:hypothetical protein
MPEEMGFDLLDYVVLPSSRTKLSRTPFSSLKCPLKQVKYPCRSFSSIVELSLHNLFAAITSTLPNYPPFVPFLVDFYPEGIISLPKQPSIQMSTDKPLIEAYGL